MKDTGPALALGRGSLRTLAVLLLPVLLATTACAGDGNGSDGDDPDPSVTATILEPTNNSTDIPTALDVSFSAEGAVETTVELEELDGSPIDGALTDDGMSWRPASQLEYGTTYVATLTAVGPDGQNAIDTSTFTTMAEPEDTIRVFSFLGPDSEIGVGMPLRIEFLDDSGAQYEIPEEHRAEVEARMNVRAEPDQEGTWHWVSGAEVHYRPREFWEPGTQINYQLTTGGVPIGEGRYLRNDLHVNVTVGREILMEVSQSSLEMTVSVDGEVRRTIPVSLGREEWRTSSGTHVIMEKFEETVFDTREEMGEDGYVVDIEHAMRLTYQGEFIHATPRSGESLGGQSVTHGCINMSPSHAEWLFDLTHSWGDPVIVEGTGSPLEPGDGWTDWNLDWEEYRRGSALVAS